MLHILKKVRYFPKMLWKQFGSHENKLFSFCYAGSQLVPVRVQHILPVGSRLGARGRKERRWMFSHLSLVDDALLFDDASENQLRHFRNI